MKRTAVLGILGIAWTAALLAPGPAQGGNTRIVIDKPVAEIVTGESISVEGAVFNPTDNYIRLRIEPFIGKKDFKAMDLTVPIIGRKFKKAVTLPSGISIITASTLDNRWSVSKPILLFSAKKGLVDQEWGRSSPIKFTEPAEMRSRRSPCAVRGRVTDRSLKTIESVLINLTDFQRLYSDRQEMPALGFSKTEVKGSEFALDAPLSDGINLLIARPEGKDAPELTQTKVIVYESSSPKISVSGSFLKNNIFAAEGTAGDAGAGRVTVKIEALVREAEGSIPFLKVVVEKDAQVGQKGNYRLALDLNEVKGLFENSYFLITVSAGKEKTSRLIVFEGF